MVSSRSFIVPIVSCVLAFFLLIGFTVGYVQYSINQNNRNVAIAEQAAIQKNNQLLCGIIVVVNESTAGSTVTSTSKKNYGIRLQEDFRKLDKEYRCGT